MSLAGIKICGIRTSDALAEANKGAQYIGFVFVPKSPRFIAPQAAKSLAAQTRDGIQKVGLFVNAQDAELDAVLRYVPLDMLQLHGSETPARVAAIKSRYGLPVIKAIPLAQPNDLGAVQGYIELVDMLLFDARTPTSLAGLPGGNALAFDWRILQGQRFSRPWFLAGGLTPFNVRDAISITGAELVDISSGVESSPGVKDPAKIMDFIRAAKGL